MLFSSIPFLYYFLPCVLILYLIAPKKLKNSVLLISSLFFYWWGEPRYVVLMVIDIVLGYVCGLLIERFRGKAASKVFLVLSVVISVGLLGYFKYADFMIGNFNAVTGLSVPLLKIALPVGISFYTFQLLSYTIDVYRGNVPAQKNPITLATYVALFPQLIAGPIVRYSDVEHQLKNRTHSFEYVSIGIRRFIIGLSKKVLIADAMYALCDMFRASGDKSVLFYWLYALAFCMFVYFDFSGYSDMAIGLGKIFGFDFLENFNYPFISKSASEFWRRWHMSLGSWFRDYVYIPMGGNRVGKYRLILNLLVVWMLTGLWHGAAWNFVIWGLYFGILLMIEKRFLTKFLSKNAVVAHIYTLFLVIISFVIFNAESMRGIFADIGGLFGAGGIPFISKETVYCLKDYGFLLVIGVVGATPLVKNIALKLREKTENVMNVLEIVFLAVLLIMVTAYFVDGSFSPFLYFRF